MKNFYFASLCAIFFSCTPKIHYVGQVSPSTKKVDVYVSESSITRKYTLIGQGYLNVWAANSRADKIQRMAEKTAKEKGADAVIITDYYFPDTGRSVTSTYKTDTSGKTIITTGNTTISTLSTVEFRIFFVKYN